MRRGLLVICVLVAMAARAKAGNIDRTDEELQQQARELMSTLLTVPGDCIVKVEPIPQGYGRGRKVVFQMEIPETRWIMSPYPEIFFLDAEEKPLPRVWDASKADEHTPSAEAIAQWFLQEKKDPERCIQILRVWFDAHRNKGPVVNYAYDRYARAYREAGRDKDWLLALEKELEQASAPEAVYEIHRHIGKVHLDNGQIDLAIRHWQLAQEAMKAQSNAYIATRYAIPFLEIAKLFLRQEKTDQAAEQLERYLATQHGEENPFEALKLLGEIYETRQEFQKARALYMTVLAEGFGSNWANAEILRTYQAPIRERVRLLDLQEKLAALVEKLADPDGKVRMKAYKDIEALGKEAVPFLRRYQQDKNVEIRGSVRELLEKMQ